MNCASAFIGLVAAVVLTSCTSSGSTVQRTGAAFSGPVTTVVVAMTDGTLDDDVRAQLAGSGVTVNFGDPISSEAALRDAATLSRLADEKVDAVIFVRQSSGNALGDPESAAVTVADGTTGKVVAALMWQNGRGFGITHSVSNVALSKNTQGAATEIVAKLQEIFQAK